MKNDKVCIGRGVGIFALVALLLIGFIFASQSLTNMRTSTNSRASEMKSGPCGPGGFCQTSDGYYCYKPTEDSVGECIKGEGRPSGTSCQKDEQCYKGLACYAFQEATYKHCRALADVCGRLNAPCCKGNTCPSKTLGALTCDSKIKPGYGYEYVNPWDTGKCVNSEKTTQNEGTAGEPCKGDPHDRNRCENNQSFSMNENVKLRKLVCVMGKRNYTGGLDTWGNEVFSDDKDTCKDVNDPDPEVSGDNGVLNTNYIIAQYPERRDINNIKSKNVYFEYLFTRISGDEYIVRIHCPGKDKSTIGATYSKTFSFAPTFSVLANGRYRSRDLAVLGEYGLPEEFYNGAPLDWEKPKASTSIRFGILSGGSHHTDPANTICGDDIWASKDITASLVVDGVVYKLTIIWENKDRSDRSGTYNFHPRGTEEK